MQLSKGKILVAAMFVVCAFPAVDAAAEGMRFIYLVRHGFYDYNDERDADVGKALVPLGVAQSRLVGDRLQSLRPPFTSFYSSTMTRARETAYVINKDLPDLELIETAGSREATRFELSQIWITVDTITNVKTARTIISRLLRALHETEDYSITIPGG